MIHKSVISMSIWAGMLITLLLLAGPSPSASAATPAGYIVVLKDSVANVPQVAQEHARAHGVGVAHIYQHALKGYAATVPDGRLANIQNDPRVAFISPDGTVQANGTTPLAKGDGAPPGIRRIGAATPTRVHEASTVSVAVLDTGIDLTHFDLNAADGTNCIDPGKTAQDDHGHGTQVAGIIGGKNNGGGVVGVAPGTQLYAVKVLGSTGGGRNSEIVCGIDWVTANAAALGIKVVNMSMGGNGSNDNDCGNTKKDAVHLAICNSTRAGVTYVAAAMNSGKDFAKLIPAVYPEVLTVTAMADTDGVPGAAGGATSCGDVAPDDVYASFSNYATAQTEINHTIAAPGACIFTTYLRSLYTFGTGTSFASPHAAGTVALCIGNGNKAGPCSGLAPAQIIQKIRSDAQTHATASNGFTGDPFHPVTGKYFGYLVYAGGY